MAKKHLFVDKTEIVAVVLGKKKAFTHNLRYDQISSIKFEKCKEFRLFRLVPSEKIVITSPKLPNPVEFMKYKEKQYFEEYKKELGKFAKDNRITFHDAIGG